MNERELRAFLVDILADFAKVGDGLAAKRAAKVAEENQKKRAFGGEGRDGAARLIFVAIRQFWIDL